MNDRVKLQSKEQSPKGCIPLRRSARLLGAERGSEAFEVSRPRFPEGFYDRLPLLMPRFRNQARRYVFGSRAVN